MTRTGRLTLLTAIAIVAALPHGARCEDIEVSAYVDRTVVSLNDQIVFTVQVEGTMRQVATPSLPDIESAFSVYSSGTSTNMSWVNGRMTASKSWNFRLLPKGVGKFKIGPVEVEFEGATYRTDPIEVEVVEGEAPAPPRELEERESSGADARGRDVFITTSVDKKTAYVGEQVTLSFKFYGRVELWDQPRYEAPELTGFWVVGVPGQEEYYESVGGIRYRVIEIKTALFGTAPGTSTIGPAALSYTGRAAPLTFFSRPGRTVTLRTDPIDVEILPLPSEGTPAGFGGAVGDYRLSYALDAGSVEQYQPVTLKVVMEGNGNIRTVPAPELPDLPEFRVYDSDTSTSTETRGARVWGRKSFEYVLVPQTAGSKSIPGIRLAFFDPAKQEYRTAVESDLTLDVTPAPEGASEPGLPARAAISRLGRDIRYIREPAGPLSRVPGPIHRRTSFLLLQIVPVLALVGVLAIRRRRDRFEQEEGLERFVRAPGRARKELRAAREHSQRGDVAGVCSAVSKALVDFVGARLRVRARGMTSEELDRALRAAGAGGELIERVRRLLSECDLGRFAGNAEAVEGERLVSEAEWCMKELERLSARRRR